MIRIRKPQQGPRILVSGRGPKKTLEICDRYVAGERQFVFEARIYQAKSVKKALISCQHGKCCYCESKGTHIAYGDVEHFRPKGGYIQKSGDILSQPGYYWLAYEWTNLFYVCQLCNQRHKQNLFPLKDPLKRALTHLDDLKTEEPLFIDPAAEEPEEYIGFRKTSAFAINGNARARATIEGMGLNRRELRDYRETVFGKLSMFCEAFELLSARQESKENPLSARELALLNKLRSELRRAVQPASEYASMARALIGGLS